MKRKTVTSLIVIVLIAMISGVSGSLFSLTEASLDYKGMSYSSWTRGEYPFTVSWKPQTYWDSQAITEVNITPNKPYSGQGSLEADVNLIGQDLHKSSGETFVDLRYHPPLSEPPCCLITPVDLKGVMIKAQIWCPEGIQGYSYAPNGLQLFVKDQAWKNFYGSWHNIEVNEWNEITVTPDTAAPPEGWMDPEFDPTKIVMIGVKIGANDYWYGNFSGKIWIDDVIWSKDGCTFQYTFENIENSLDTLRKTNTNYVSLMVTWYMDNKNSNTIESDPVKSHTDYEIEKTISEIHNRGMSVLLKPHVDVKDDTWRGAIDPSDKDAWFNSYRDFITHYATIAQNNSVELFCVGTELESLSGEAFRSQWNTTIDDIRSVYKGPLTYAANWDGYTLVSFWDKIDILGIDAYFPLSDAPNPSLDELMKGWVNYSGKYGDHNWVEEIETWQSNINKPIIFTEIGYKSIDYAAKEPWNCSESSNCELQARCYEAAIDTFKNKHWFKGMFWWNWLTVSDAGGCCNTDFTPQNKPAEHIITKKYSKFEFDTGEPEDPYPSIFGTHNGTIKPNQTITVSKLYTYPCAGTGGHSEYVWIYGNGINESVTWNGYQGAGDYHYIEFSEPFTLEANVTYNYTIKTGSYPQIHHNTTLTVSDGEITCSEFIDANGKRYDDWIPAIRLE